MTGSRCRGLIDLPTSKVECPYAISVELVGLVGEVCKSLICNGLEPPYKAWVGGSIPSAPTTKNPGKSST